MLLPRNLKYDKL